jgi:hypothetical protein
MIRSVFATVTIALLPVLALAQSGAAGQSGVPRTADGKPDLSGIWQVMNTANWNIQDHTAEKGVPAGQGIVEGNELPYTPAAAAKKKSNYENRASADPETKCYLPGVPRATYLPFPFQIVQTPEQITVLYEYAHAVRNIFMNTPHISGQLFWWMGDSRARWEGDTLVVDVTDFNDETWFDHAGNFHSAELHVVERYALLDADHITYEVTIEDPKVFTRPWKMSMVLNRHREKNFRLLEYECFSF